jgi:hypothetical protein
MEKLVQLLERKRPKMMKAAECGHDFDEPGVAAQIIMLKRREMILLLKTP